LQSWLNFLLLLWLGFFLSFPPLFKKYY
jgi:hypothetical protein